MLSATMQNVANVRVVKITTGYMGLDIGPKAIEEFRRIILDSKTILWNGPMGVFEFSNFQQGTKAVAEAVAESTSKGAYSLIGGGDSGFRYQQI
jgi:phosphoglycerate kinase